MRRSRSISCCDRAFPPSITVNTVNSRGCRFGAAPPGKARQSRTIIWAVSGLFGLVPASSRNLSQRRGRRFGGREAFAAANLERFGRSCAYRRAYVAPFLEDRVGERSGDLPRLCGRHGVLYLSKTKRFALCNFPWTKARKFRAWLVRPPQPGRKAERAEIGRDRTSIRSGPDVRHVDFSPWRRPVLLPVSRRSAGRESVGTGNAGGPGNRTFGALP